MRKALLEADSAQAVVAPDGPAADAPPAGPAAGGAVLLRALLDHLPAIVCTIDEAGHIRFINRVPAGLTVAAVLGRSCLDFVAPAHRETARRAFAETLGTGRPTTFELQANGPGGALSWYATTVLPLHGSPDGARLVLVTEDVTSRHEAERTRRIRELERQAIIDGTDDLIHVKDTAGRYTLVNRALCRFSGLAAGQILGRDDTDFLPPALAREARDQDRQVTESAETVSLHFTARDAEGRERTLHAVKHPLRDAAGRVVGVVGIARDVTELLAAEARRRRDIEESHNLLELALAGSELGTWDADLLTGTVKRNDRLLAMLGYTRDELQPTLEQWWRLLHPDDQPAVHAARQAHLDGDTRIHESEHRLRHRDGHWVWVLESGKVQRDAEGRPVRAVGTTRDISERRRMQAVHQGVPHEAEDLMRGAGRPPAAASLPGVSLPPRQRQVLALLAQGLTSRQVARRLGIAVPTADTHRRDLLRKLGLRNKAELVRYAVAHGLVDPSF